MAVQEDSSQPEMLSAPPVGLLDALLRSTELFVVVLGRDGRVRMVNDACLAASGLPASEVIGRPFWEGLVVEADAPRMRAMFAGIDQNGVPEACACCMPMRNGSQHRIRWKLATLSNASDGAGHQDGLVLATGFAFDGQPSVEHEGGGSAPSSRRQCQHNTGFSASAASGRLQAVALRNRLDAMRVLTGSLVHELSQPLAAVTANAHAARALLERSDNPDARIRRAVAQIIRGGERAAGTVGDLRDCLRPARGASSQPRDINALIQDVLDWLSPTLEINDVHVACDLDAHLPPVTVDRIRIEQLLVNLVTNAVETMAGWRAEKCLRIRSERDATSCTVEVHSSGAGLDPDVLSRPFDADRTPRAHGLWQGLAISRSIVEAHGGNLFAGNHPSGGALIRVVMPLADTHDE